MPYITHKAKIDVYWEGAKTAGELNYSLTQVVLTYLQNNGLSYQHINDAIGALEGAKLELYRRVAAPYEDTKIAENGDVYPAGLLPKVHEYPVNWYVDKHNRFPVTKPMPDLGG
jgi:hypothetical protein